MLPSKLKLVGLDPSLRNWGIVTAFYDLFTEEITLLKAATVSPFLSQSKQIRQNSLDIEAAKQLYDASKTATLTAYAVFAEVPVGSQSSRSMTSYGVCVGVLGSLQSEDIPIYQVTANEVKLAATGNPQAKKKDMIKWATTKYPDHPWETYKKNGSILLTESVIEHQADALGAIYAGIQLPEFKRNITMLKESHETRN